MSSLYDRLTRHTARVTILGQGYVGLPLALAFAEAGFPVTGVDVDADRASRLSRGEPVVEDVSAERLGALIQAGRYAATSSFDVLNETDVAIICVPTPLSKTRDPDISYIVSACDEIASRLHRDMLVVLESTTYPGTTDEVIRPKLTAGSLALGKDFYLAFSPERIDPGNRHFSVTNTPKVIGGATEACLRHAKALYGAVIETLVPVSSTMAAEMVKLLENTYRAVNIGLVNEIALMCDRLRLDVWEIIEAAATKPFGFTPFYPGPGLGGHCIPVDPHYLSWKLKTLNYTARFIELAAEVNSAMPEHWAEKVADCLNEQSRSVRGANVLILGVAYKAGVSDTRESPGLEIMKILHAKGAALAYCDPGVPSVALNGERIAARPFGPDPLEWAHCIVVATAERAFTPHLLRRCRARVVDTRNLLGRSAAEKAEEKAEEKP